MEKLSEKVINLFKSFEEKTFISIKHCNYTTAVQQFLEQNGVILEKQDILEGEKESYIDRYGVFKYQNIIKLKSLDLKLQISCLFQKGWEFQFDGVLPPHLQIIEERIIKTEEKTVFVTYLNEEKQRIFYAVPIKLAETLDLEEFHDKNIEEEVKKEMLLVLEPYKITSMIQLK